VRACVQAGGWACVRVVGVSVSVSVSVCVRRRRAGQYNSTAMMIMACTVDVGWPVGWLVDKHAQRGGLEHLATTKSLGFAA
jgi:hypothetical protein